MFLVKEKGFSNILALYLRNKITCYLNEVAGHKIDTQKSGVLLNISNEQYQNEIM